MQQARQCLDSRHIVFLGDSLTRYQYLSLVYFLSKGHYMERYGGGSSPSLCLEKEWDSWQHFYREGPTILSNATDAEAHEGCDCVKSGWKQHKEREFRDFTLYGYNKETADDILDTGSITVSYAQVFATPTFETAGQLFLELYLEQLPLRYQKLPDSVVFNTGLWGLPAVALLSPVQQLAIFLGIAKIGTQFHQKRNPHTRLIWKTITVSAQNEAEPDMENLNEAGSKAFATDGNWDIMDARIITQAAKNQGLNLYWDQMHFLPFVYEELNDVLLNMLCSPENVFVERSLS
ncbi:hypothetical protein ABBQ38_000735 [Trebouxia sp. C0009 RCD-2024]